MMFSMSLLALMAVLVIVWCYRKWQQTDEQAWLILSFWISMIAAGAAGLALEAIVMLALIASWQLARERRA